MTAPTRGGADEIREQVAAALPESLGPVSLRRPSPPLIPDGRPEPRGYGDHLIDALLPTVQALIAKGAAAELRKAAFGLTVPQDHGGPPATASDGTGEDDELGWCVQTLRDRADALDGTP